MSRAARMRFVFMVFAGLSTLFAEDGGGQYQDYTLISPLTAEHKDTDYKIISVPIIRATEETVKGYGHIVSDKDTAIIDITAWPAQGWRAVTTGTGRGGGTVKELYEIYWEYGSCYAINHTTKVKYLIGWLADLGDTGIEGKPQTRRVMVTSEVDYHPDGGQLLFPLEKKPFFLLLALPGDDVKPQDFKALYFDGSVGFHIDPGVWHQIAFPVDGSLSMYNQQGAVFACIDCDFIQEFDCLLAIDLDFLPV